MRSEENLGHEEGTDAPEGLMKEEPSIEWTSFETMICLVVGS